MNVRAPGFSLVELIVALTILSVGLLALAGSAAVAQRSFAGARAVEEGVDAAALVLDSLLREPTPTAGERRNARTVARWSVREDSAAVTIDLRVTAGAGSRERQMSFRATHHAR